VYEEVSRRITQLREHTALASLSAGRIGLEKETLRIDSNGVIAQTDHPAELGAALCNANITTDFSEALLEMVTPPCDSAASAIEYLIGLHQFILPRLHEGEGLWNTSMPCVLHGDDSIRIGEYGSSHNGKMKKVYRRGLGLRYGRRMQAIAGIHFNFSLPDIVWPLHAGLHAGAASLQQLSPDSYSDDDMRTLRTEGYFQMTRNLMRIGWMVPYLFGASPAICQTFLPSGADSDLSTFNRNTRFAEHGTSLRMGEIGYRYKEDTPIDLSVRHDSFEHYLEDIIKHVTTVHPAYEEAGIRDEHNDYQQLNTKKLQIENEYYSSVRPKQIPDKGEMPIIALQNNGIRYLELRSVDVNVFDPAGMNLEQVATLELLMLFAWLGDSPALHSQEMDINNRNIKKVAHRGREPGLTLQYGQQEVLLKDWGNAVLESIQPLATWLDEDTGNDLYQRSLAAQLEKMQNPDLTPSARVVRELDEHGSFFQLVTNYSAAQHQELLQLPTNPKLQQRLRNGVDQSIAKQQELEAATQGRFEDFLNDYFSQLKVPLPTATA